MPGIDSLENIDILVEAFADELGRVGPHRHLDRQIPEQFVEREE